MKLDLPKLPKGSNIIVGFLPFYEGNSHFTFWEVKGNTVWKALDDSYHCFSLIFMKDIATSLVGKKKKTNNDIGTPGTSQRVLPMTSQMVQ